MVQSLKEIKNRIRSIQNTKKVTAAMGMVSFAKLNKIEKILPALRPYFLKLDKIYGDLLGTLDTTGHPFFEKRVPVKKIALCLITSDSGLCGVYNHNIISLAERFLDGFGLNKVNLFLVGRKGFQYFRKRGVEVSDAYLGLNGKYSYAIADEIADKLLHSFNSRAVDEVHVAYTQFQTAFLHRPTINKILNLERKVVTQNEFILEPDRPRILELLLRNYLLQDFRFMLLQSFAAEHASRVIAMRSATDNAQEIVNRLTLTKNKMRQANITQEIMEVVSAVEALRG